MKKPFTIIFVLLLLLTSLFQPTIAKADKTNDNTSFQWPEGPDASSLCSESAIVMDAATGLILYEKNIHEVHYPASITKILTTLIALENSSLNEIVTYSKNAVYGIEPGSSHIAIDVGEQLTMEQSLYGIMLESANEACLGVAEHISGSIDAYVELMNQKAQELGCTDSHFMNPNGLHDDNHYTTAYDMALISREAIKNETFRKITSTKSYIIPKTNIKPARDWIKNHHQMLNGYKYPQYEYEYCIGGKTGYTTKAQNTLVTFAEKDGMTLICVVMKSQGPAYPSNEYTDTKKLFDFCFQNYSIQTISSLESNSLEEDFPLFDRYNSLLNNGQLPIYLDNCSSVILPNNVDISEVTQTISYFHDTSLSPGENIIGTIEYTYDGKVVGSGNIIYNQIDSPRLVTKTSIQEVKQDQIGSDSTNKVFPVIIICIVIITLIIIVFFAISYHIKRKRAKNFSLRQHYRRYRNYNRRNF
ncbi:D-alanyl-D-alanine carboxypeptidase family protein [Anaeromicropila populeti]|uniref:D-alanyl-D-alanine carboxypeptidase n=1 Tax=Anaeromicropila populeti TaxID=37658 RepID=A0A1I6LAP9_9FIRM|nr:D-alanyl-D-alanine carboxypeptidase family protein [Anaeromicropila populeti]SFS00563.1 D-alanyl-D-alanine carboxypeptidase [Anaeromicropila populeti]